MRSKSLLCLTLLATFATGALCQTKLPVQQAIEAQFPVTKATYDHKDMVTPGAVIDLLKDNLVMSAITEPTISTGTYKDGKFQYGGFNKFVKCSRRGRLRPARVPLRSHQRRPLQVLRQVSLPGQGLNSHARRRPRLHQGIHQGRARRRRGRCPGATGPSTATGDGPHRAAPSARRRTARLT